MAYTISASNANILNTVRANASHAYQERIPAVSDADVSKAMLELKRYTPMWNEFVETLLNVVGLRLFNMNKFENRLKPLQSGSLPFGGMVAEYGMDLIKADDYDVDDVNVFGAEKPEIRVTWHRVTPARSTRSA